MALLNYIRPNNQYGFKVICLNLIPKILQKYVHNSKSINSEVDTLDVFTTQLMQNKINRWGKVRIQRRINENNKMNIPLTTDMKIDIRQYDRDDLNSLIYETIIANDTKNIDYLINQCIIHNICPVPGVLNRIFSYFSQKGDRATVISLQKLAETAEPVLFRVQAKFQHYLAQAIWVKGNLTEALDIFEDVYKRHSFLRRKLRFMFRYMIIHVTTERSEAPLVLVTKFAERISQKHEDYFPLACVWQSCFLSEWYADQCRASELLERYEKLCDEILCRIIYVVNFSLRNHRIEVVYRLFEELLKYNIRTYYSFVLQSLFNYKYIQNDLRSCAEILQWSKNVNVPLNNVQHNQFISLLLNQDTVKKKKPEKPKDYQLKF